MYATVSREEGFCRFGFGHPGLSSRKPLLPLCAASLLRVHSSAATLQCRPAEDQEDHSPREALAMHKMGSLMPPLKREDGGREMWVVNGTGSHAWHLMDIISPCFLLAEMTTGSAAALYCTVFSLVW